MLVHWYSLCFVELSSSPCSLAASKCRLCGAPPSPSMLRRFDVGYIAAHYTMTQRCSKSSKSIVKFWLSEEHTKFEKIFHVVLTFTKELYKAWGRLRKFCDIWFTNKQDRLIPGLTYTLTDLIQCNGWQFHNSWQSPRLKKTHCRLFPSLLALPSGTTTKVHWVHSSWRFWWCSFQL